MSRTTRKSGIPAVAWFYSQSFHSNAHDGVAKKIVAELAPKEAPQNRTGSQPTTSNSDALGVGQSECGDSRERPAINECPECGHASVHGRYGCEYERGDKWVDHGNGERLVAQGPCGCAANYTNTRASSVDFEIVRPADMNEAFTLAGNVAALLLNARDYLLNKTYDELNHRAIMDAVAILRERSQEVINARSFILTVKWLERAA